jgi:hypothetical protein
MFYNRFSAETISKNKFDIVCNNLLDRIFSSISLTLCSNPKATETKHNFYKVEEDALLNVKHTLESEYGFQCFMQKLSNDEGYLLEIFWK